MLDGFKAGFDGTPVGNFVDILDQLDDDGKFSLDAALLDAIAGGLLNDGPHTLHLQAVDISGNTSDIFDVFFTLDTTPPVANIEPPGIIHVAPSSITVAYDQPVTGPAFDLATFSLTVDGGPNDGQSVEIVSVEQQNQFTAQINFAEPLPDDSYRLTIDADLVDPAGNQLIEPLLVMFTVADPTGIREISPAHGEEMVNVTRETIVRFDEQVDPTTITDEAFHLIANGQRLPGRIVTSSTERFVTFFYDDPLPASTEVRIVINGDLIIGRDGLALDADGDDQPGGTATADFRTLPLTRILGTNVFGFVRDSFSEEPIVGATIRVDAFPEANAVTDENGRFELVDMPAPEFFVHVDGSTATNIPVGFMYPNVGKPFHSVPGETVQLEMNREVFDIYLPTLALDDIQPLSATETTAVGFGDDGKAKLAEMFPGVDPAMLDLMQVMIAPGAAVDDQGNPATTATIIPVPPDRIPAPLPANLNPSLVVSIQTPGATNFDVPAPITFPNLDGLASAEKTLIFSFDHDSGEWKVIGTGTVSEDELSIVSDPGVGIVAPGWHQQQQGSIGDGDAGADPGGSESEPECANTLRKNQLLELQHRFSVTKRVTGYLLINIVGNVLGLRVFSNHVGRYLFGRVLKRLADYERAYDEGIEKHRFYVDCANNFVEPLRVQLPSTEIETLTDSTWSIFLTHANLQERALSVIGDAQTDADLSAQQVTQLDGITRELDNLLGGKTPDQFYRPALNRLDALADQLRDTANINSTEQTNYILEWH